MTSLLADLRHALRQLTRSPAFGAGAVLILALGIGANTTFFAAVNAIVFRPMRAVHLDDVWRPTLQGARWHNLPLLREHFDLLEENLPDEIEAADLFVVRPALVHVPGRAERVEVQFVTGGHAQVFDLQPQAGRFITPGDDRLAARVAVLSDRLWREWFGGSRAALGTLVRVDAVAYEVVGVAPVGYRGAYAPRGNADLWLPLATDPSLRAAPAFPWTHFRARPGTSPDLLAARVEAAIATGPRPQGDDFTVRVRAPAQDPGPKRAGLLVLGLSMLVLVAACANVANMLYTRGVHRASEMAVRRSLGATPMRLFRLLFAEAALLASAASALGLAIALAATRLLNDAYPAFRDRAARVTIDLTPDYRVFVYALCAGAAASLAVGVLTAWGASRVTPWRGAARGESVMSTARIGRGLRGALVASQVTAAVVLLMGAGLFLRQTHGAFEKRTTFDTRPLAAARLELARHGYNDSRAQAFLPRLLHAVRAIPGVDHAVITDGIPGGISMGGEPVTFAAERERRDTGAGRFIDGSHRRVNGILVSASTGFLRTIGVDLRAGRNFDEGDRDGAPLVAIVSERTASRLWGDDDAIGRQLMLGNEGHWRTVVGISADPAAAPELDLGYPAANLVVVPLSQRRQPPLTTWQTARYDDRFRRELLVVLRSDHPRAQIEPLRAALRELDSRVAVYDAASVDESILAWVGPLNAARLVMASLAALALAISIAGMYSVLAFMVARRTREFGIRLALGAERRRILRMVFDDAARLLLVGLLAGTFAAAVTERIIDARRFGLLPNEISTWAAVLVVILTVGLGAAWVPARRAAGLDPNVALREL